jgi:hypothetical protein
MGRPASGLQTFDSSFLAGYARRSCGRYNRRVTAPGDQSAHKDDGHYPYASETAGLLVIAVMLLILTLIRYWHNLEGSLR